MTKSEANIIRDLVGTAQRILLGTDRERGIPYSKMDKVLAAEVHAAIQVALNEIARIGEMARAEIEK